MKKFRLIISLIKKFTVWFLITVTIIHFSPSNILDLWWFKAIGCILFASVFLAIGFSMYSFHKEQLPSRQVKTIVRPRITHLHGMMIFSDGDQRAVVSR